MNYAPIETDILNYIADGKAHMCSLSTKSQMYLAGMLASSQTIELQMEIWKEATIDNAEIPGPLFNRMIGLKPVYSAEDIINRDVLHYLADDLSNEYNRLFDKYHSPEEVACREADEEDKIL